MGRFRRAMLGHDAGETAEHRVRRLAALRWNGYIQPVLPPIVELYDRIAALEARVAELELPRTASQ